MATQVMDTKAAEAAVAKDAEAKKVRELADQVFKFLSTPGHSAIAYAPEVIVNNLWEELDTYLAMAHEVQDKYDNPTEFRKEFLVTAIKNQLKTEARNRAGEWDRMIDKWSKEHKTVKLSRAEIEVELQKSRAGKNMFAMAAKGAEVTQALK